MAATSIPTRPRTLGVPADATWDGDASSGSGGRNEFGMVATLRQNEAEPTPP